MPENFQLLHKTLQDKNNLISEGSLLPQLFYSKSYEDFYFEFKKYCSKNNLKQFIVVTDGAPKNSGHHNEDITHLFLKNSPYPTVEINLSQLCKIKHEDIRASEEILNSLMEVIALENDTHFISLGSGTITDLLKHALFLLKKNDCHFISVPSATTVTAFTSHFSVIDINGAKKTRPSRKVDATFWIEPLLQSAPLSMQKAGFGDLLASFVSYADWFLAHKLNLTNSYNTISHELLKPYEEFLKGPLHSSLVGQEYLTQNMEMFAQTLSMSGIGMSLCGETTPASGYEHVISHGLDFLRLSSKRPLVLHGEQVALCTLSSASSFQWLHEQSEFNVKSFRSLNEKDIQSVLLKLLSKAPFLDNQERNLPLISQLFLEGALEKNKKWNNTQSHIQETLQQWNFWKQELQSLVIKPNELEKIMIQVGLPTFPEETTPPMTALEFRWSMRFAPFIRPRFCLADFIFWIGEDPCAIAAV